MEQTSLLPFNFRYRLSPSQINNATHHQTTTAVTTIAPPTENHTNNTEPHHHHRTGCLPKNSRDPRRTTLYHLHHHHHHRLPPSSLAPTPTTTLSLSMKPYGSEPGCRLQIEIQNFIHAFNTFSPTEIPKVQCLMDAATLYFISTERGKDVQAEEIDKIISKSLDAVFVDSTSSLDVIKSVKHYKLFQLHKGLNS